MRSKLSFTLLVACVLSSSPIVAEDQPSNREFSIQTLGPLTAETMVWDLCKGFSQSAECQVRAASGESIVVRGTTAVHEAVARMLKDAADEAVARMKAAAVTPLPTQTFHFSLIEGRAGAPGFSGDISEAGKAALRDVRELLPFKAFRLVDSGLVRTQRVGEVRLSGDGRSYVVNLHYNEWSDTGDAPKIGLNGLELLEMRPAEPLGSQEGKYGRHRVMPILETSLTLELGETVVVGTSKLNGGAEALILLVTAVR